MSDKKPQAGEWWMCDDNSTVRVVGVKLNGVVAAEHECGTITFHSSTNLWTHLPDCDSFDWQPETFPQWYVSADGKEWVHHAYAKRISATEYHLFHLNGMFHRPEEWSEFEKTGVKDGRWKQVTQAEAESRVKKPEPVESPDDYVTQDRVPVRVGIDQVCWLWKDGSGSDCWSLATGPWIDKYHGSDAGNAMLAVRCRRRDLPPLPEEQPKRKYARFWYRNGDGRFYIADASKQFIFHSYCELKHDGTGFYLEDGK